MRAKLKLTAEQIRVSWSMDKYWQEIVDRDNADKYCQDELINSVIPILGAKNIILILHDYINKPPASRGKIKEGWHEAGVEFDILGAPVEVGGQNWTPIKRDDEDDPTWFKTAGIAYIIL